MQINLPPLGAPVLEPGFDLRVGHFEGFGQGGPFCGGQVLLFVKALLQLGDLQSGERGARLLSLGRRAVLVRVTDSPRDRERGCNTNTRKTLNFTSKLFKNHFFKGRLMRRK